MGGGGTREVRLPRPPGGPAPWLVGAGLAGLALLTVVTASGPVEVLTSTNGQDWASQGHLKTDLRWRDLPANHFWTDEETLTAHTFRHVPAAPVKARYVQYKIINPRHLCVTEVEVLDDYSLKPFDLRIALPE